MSKSCLNLLLIAAVAMLAIRPNTTCAQRIVASSLPQRESTEQATTHQSSSSDAFNTSPPSRVIADEHERAQACVLLKNDHVLFGTAQQVGDTIIVRTGHGGEVRLNRAEVACWAPSIRDLYQFRVDHREPASVQSHLRDARWCLHYDLFDLAERELKTLRDVAPHLTELKSLQRQLDRARSQATASKGETATNSIDRPSVGGSTLRIAAGHASNESSSHVQPAGFSADRSQDSIEDDNAIGAIAVDPQLLQSFARHIQPLLMNRCGRCHGQSESNTQSVQWRINRTPIGTRASSQTTQDNLSGVLAFVDSTNPEASALWIKATSAHGGAGPALTTRNAKAIIALRQWLTIASDALVRHASEAQSQTRTTGDSNASQSAMPRPLDQSSFASGAQGGEESVPNAQIQPRVVPHSPTPSDSSRYVRQPDRLPPVANPFDPDLFNRRVELEQSQLNPSARRPDQGTEVAN